MSFDIMIWAIIISAILMMPLGAFIYSEIGLGKMWMDAIGKTKSDIENDSSSMPKLMLLALLSSLVTVFLVNVLIVSIGISTVANLLLLLIIVYLILFIVRFKGVLFDGNKKLFIVNLTATFFEFVIVFIVYMFFI